MTVKNDILSDNLENTSCHPVCRYLGSNLHSYRAYLHEVYIPSAKNRISSPCIID